MKRRNFIKTAAGIAIGLPQIIPSSALGKDGEVAASNRIAIGCIGVGSRGNGVLGGFLRHADARVVAVCDVNGHRRTAALQRVNDHYQATGCREYRD